MFTYRFKFYKVIYLQNFGRQFMILIYIERAPIEIRAKNKELHNDVFKIM